MSMIYLVDTKFKKIKKLARLSLNIIHDFGFIYFCRIGFEELKKQKLQLFLPESKQCVSEPVNEKLSYDMWKKSHSLSSKKITVQNKISKLNFTPKITILLMPQKDLSYDLKSIQSILNQFYENLELVLISKKIAQSDLQNNILNDCRIVLENNNNLDSEYLNKIISKTSGDYLGFVDCNDILTPDALFYMVHQLNEFPESDIVYSDEDQLDSKGNRINPFFKPDWSPYLFLGINYLQKFCLIRKSIFVKSNGLRDEFDDNMLYDLLLRCSEMTENITHVPLPLCSVKTLKNNPSNDEFAIKAISEALTRRKINANVTNGTIPKTFKIQFSIDSKPKVSIIISTKDNISILKRCLKSIEKNTNYKNWELIIVNNDSKKNETISYLKSLPYTILNYNAPFNFSKMNNLATKYAKGEYLLFLNDDIAVLDPNWLDELVSLCNQKDVGIVGPKLIHSDHSIQHAGMIFLKTGAGFHPFYRTFHESSGYHGFLNVTREYSAVTGACLLIKKELFEKVDLFDENFDVYYGDSDLCLKIRQLGYYVLYTPNTLLLHEGSAKIRESTSVLFDVENHFKFTKKWPYLKKGDPFYNPNLGWNYSIHST